MLLFAQCFAIMPLKGLYSDSIKDVKLVLKYPGTLVTVVFLIVGGLSTFSFTKDLIAIGINAKNIGNYKLETLIFQEFFVIWNPCSWIDIFLMWVNSLYTVSIAGQTMELYYWEVDASGFHFPEDALLPTAQVDFGREGVLGSYRCWVVVCS